jgi:hypothetical protein
MIVHTPDCPDRAVCDCWTMRGGQQSTPTLVERLEASRQAPADRPDLRETYAAVDQAVRQASGVFRTFAQNVRQVGEATREWGLFRPHIHIIKLPSLADIPDDARPGDRLVWRPLGAGESSWVDEDTGLPLGNSLAWPARRRRWRWPW